MKRVQKQISWFHKNSFQCQQNWNRKILFYVTKTRNLNTNKKYVSSHDISEYIEKKKNQLSDCRKKYNDAINEKNLSCTSYRSMWKKWKRSDSCSHQNNDRNDNVNKLNDSDNRFFQNQNRLCLNQSTARLPQLNSGQSDNSQRAFNRFTIKCSSPDHRKFCQCIWLHRGQMQSPWHHIHLIDFFTSSGTGLHTHSFDQVSL